MEDITMEATTAGVVISGSAGNKFPEIRSNNYKKTE
ncbi:hypothetical protein ABIB30_003529 [Pedobacter sp. UYP1]